ncbi:hypothetical protein RRF57_007666 [Xylaria bambusicola]|uniref:Uncharacterized protein n=1 Tax=Xylaria bambusicola TaxID=326684 RepID=A0AAN7Z6H0_9PEZI
MVQLSSGDEESVVDDESLLHVEYIDVRDEVDEHRDSGGSGGGAAASNDSCEEGNIFALLCPVMAP